MSVRFVEFSDGGALANALAAKVAATLQRAITARGAASLAVSGGSTPKRFFGALSRCELDWAAVKVTLVDERWVPASDPRSNEALVRAELLRNRAVEARFVSLYTGEANPEAALERVAGELAKGVLPLDAVVLGMGTDGHTASFFPGGDRLSQATDRLSADVVASMRAPGAGEPRITLTLPAIAAAGLVAVHFEGEAKRQVWDEARSGGDADELPIRHVLSAVEELEVYWAP